MGGIFSPRTFHNACFHCLDRPPTTEKPSGGGENGDQSELISSHVQKLPVERYIIIITGWRTTIVNDDFYFDDIPGLRVVRGGYLTAKSFGNRGRSLQANTSWKEMLHTSSPVLSSTSWSRNFYRGDFYGDCRRSFIAFFYSYVEYQVFIVASRNASTTFHNNLFAFYSYYNKFIIISF